MARVKLKQQVLEEGIKRHQVILDDYRSRIKDILDNEGTVNAEEYDESVQAFNAGSSKEVNLLTEQLNVANQEMESLFKMQSYVNVIHHKAERGAVVVTDKGNFFISGSIKPFDVNGETYTCLSVNSPLFKIMEGKQAGETFTFRKTNYLIRDIF
ncbi:MAG: hypothetical protein JST14_08955 [Bacteroidetes bacterium]|nr:hypothetical protein [Bacteroidota bacterium]MBS1978065.1 hypothetical protein [Bacteroidota bacterium]